MTLPLGTVISPSAADGLGDCTHQQFFGSGPPEQRPATPGSCPRDSQVGTVRVKPRDLEEELTGDVYLGRPECTGPGGVCTQDAANGNMVRLYVQLVGEGEDGVVVKLEGTVRSTSRPGRSRRLRQHAAAAVLRIQADAAGGERATLANPRTCGEAHTTVDLTPWSTPFTPDASPTSAFESRRELAPGVPNSVCAGAQFNPTFSSGTTANQAGGYSPFSVAFGRWRSRWVPQRDPGPVRPRACWGCFRTSSSAQNRRRRRVPAVRKARSAKRASRPGRAPTRSSSRAAGCTSPARIRARRMGCRSSCPRRRGPTRSRARRATARS